MDRQTPGEKPSVPSSPYHSDQPATGSRRLVYSFYQAGSPRHSQARSQEPPLYEEEAPIHPSPDYPSFQPESDFDFPYSDPAPEPVYDDAPYQNPGYEAEPSSPKPPEAPPRRKKVDKRALLERRLSLVVLAFLALNFTILTLLMLFLPRSTESKIEKRKLAEFPKFSLQSYFSGEFTSGIATFFTDTVPMRDNLKNAGNNFKAIFGLPQAEGTVQFVGKVNKVGKEDSPIEPQPTPANSEPDNSQAASEPSAAPVGAPQIDLEGAAGRNMESLSPTPGPPAKVDIADDYSYENGIVLVKTDGHYRGLELFGGGTGESYAQALNDLYSQVGSNVNIWSMPAPKASEFYLPEAAQEYNASQSDCFDRTAALLDPGIHSLNICPVLAEHADEPIYCRTDHHWQPLGAYYAAKAFAEAANLPFDDISTYQKGKIEGFVGSMYSLAGLSELLNDPEDFVYYRPAKDYSAVYYDAAFNFLWDEDDFFQEGATGSDAYLYNLGGDQYIVKGDTQVQNGRRVLIIKDSYGNAIPPFLTGTFQQIYVADMRYLERNLVSFIRDMEITDVLFTMASYSVVGENADNLSYLLTQNAGETVTDDQPTGNSDE